MSSAKCSLIHNITDLGQTGGNHHRCSLGIIKHLTAAASNYSACPGGNGGSHPTAAVGQKVSGEFTQFLNVAYNRGKGIWKSVVCREGSGVLMKNLLVLDCRMDADKNCRHRKR